MLQKFDVLVSEQQEIFLLYASKIGCSSFGTALNIFVTLL